MMLQCENAENCDVFIQSGGLVLLRDMVLNRSPGGKSFEVACNALNTIVGHGANKLVPVLGAKDVASLIVLIRSKALILW